MTCPTTIQPLYIECPTGSNYQVSYNTPTSWFETIYGVVFLKLMVQPEEYIRLQEGESSRIIRSFRQPTKTIKRKQVGFVVTLGSEDNIKWRYILEQIEAASNQLSPTAQAIRVIDYVRPDFTAAIASNSNPHTIRQGFLEVEPGSGTSGNGSDRFSTNGLRFSFRELSMI